MDHVLLHCEVASELWYDMFNRIGVALVMPRRVVERSKGQLSNCRCLEYDPFMSWVVYLV